MPPRAPQRRDPLTALRTELELSTFLNKGILQTNAELKARLAEVEAENAALRRAESHLTAVEDALEASQKRVHRLEAAAAAAGSTHRAAMGDVMRARDAADRSAQGWREKYEALLGRVQDAQKCLQEPEKPAKRPARRSDVGVSRAKRARDDEGYASPAPQLNPTPPRSAPPRLRPATRKRVIKDDDSDTDPLALL